MLKIHKKARWIGLEFFPLEPLCKQNIEEVTKEHFVVQDEFNLTSPAYSIESTKEFGGFCEFAPKKQCLGHLYEANRSR
jgi:hypothetical protein